VIVDLERSLRDKEIQVSHLMACVYDEQNRTQDKQHQVLRLDTERLEMGRKLAEMESIKRLHVGELEARNRAMISELDTARMELDNKIREKRELMQAHAAYVEEMERQHAGRVDELDTLVQQYRATIWQYESKVEGLEKELARSQQAAEPRPKMDMSAFASSNENESIEDVRAKNGELVAEYEGLSQDLDVAEGQRDAARREVEALRRELDAAREALSAQADENYQFSNQVSSLQKGQATAVAQGGAPGGASHGGAAASSGASTAAGGGRSGAPGASTAAGGGRGGATGGPSGPSGPGASRATPSSAMASGDARKAEEMIRQQQAAAAAAMSAANQQYDDLRKKLLHTCVDLLDEFDDNRVKTAKELITNVEDTL